MGKKRRVIHTWSPATAEWQCESILHATRWLRVKMKLLENHEEYEGEKGGMLCQERERMIAAWPSHGLVWRGTERKCGTTDIQRWKTKLINIFMCKSLSKKRKQKGEKFRKQDRFLLPASTLNHGNLFEARKRLNDPSKTHTVTECTQIITCDIGKDY